LRVAALRGGRARPQEFHVAVAVAPSGHARCRKGSVRDAWRKTMIARPPLAWPRPVDSAESRMRPKRPDCPHCGSRLLVAEQSRFDLAGRIDHLGL